VEKLRELGLLEVYEAAGFTRGPPGCSYCVGLSAEKAGEGETWLSSRNRNFKNRMGKGRPSTQRTTAGEAILKHVMTNDNRKALLET
jgi:homoaconitase/3-isopropylmalate dehydratase large subunit